jgi:hypothetical protein
MGDAVGRASRQAVEPAAGARALEGAEHDAGSKTNEERGTHQEERARHGVAEYIQHRPLVRDRLTEVSRGNRSQISQILLGYRAIETVARTAGLAHFGCRPRVGEHVRERLARSGMDQEESDRRRQPDDQQSLRQPLQDDARHVRAKIWRGAGRGHDAADVA